MDGVWMMKEGENRSIVRILPLGSVFKAKKYHLIDNKMIDCLGKECDNCERYRELWRTAENHNPPQEARLLKPLERFHYQVIVRGEEDEGVKVFTIGKQLHQKIIKGIVETKIRMPWHERLWRWIKSFFVKIRTWTILDWDSGRDFEIQRELKATLMVPFPDYSSSRFLEDRKPVGTKEQMERWRHGVAE